MFRARIIQFILRRRKLVAIAVGLITLVALLSATRVRFNSSMDVWFLEDDPAMETYHRFLQSFGGDELVVVGLFTDDIYTPEGLATLDQLTREAAAAPWVHRVISLTTLEVARDEGGAMEVTPLVPKGALGDAEIAALRAEILRHPSVTGNLVAADGTAAAVLVEMDQEGGDLLRKRQLSHHLQEVIGRLPLGSRAYLAGTPVLDGALLDYTIRDMLVVGPASWALIFLMTWLIFRRRSATVVPMAVVALACVWLAGLMGATGMNLTLVSIGLIPLMLAVGIANAVHFISDYFQRLMAGLDREGAIEASLDHLLIPCFFTSATTVAGFLSLAISELPAIREFGLLAAAGVAFAFVISMGFIPTLLRAVSPPQPEYAERLKRGLISRLLLWLAHPQPRRSRWALAATAPLVALSLWGLTTLHAGANPINYFPRGDALRTAVEEIDEHLGGSTSFEVIVSAPDEGFKDPQVLSRLADLETYLREQPGVTGVVSVLEPLKEIRRVLAGGAPEEAILPDSPELAAQLYLMLESGDQLRSFVHDDLELGRVTARARLNGAQHLADASDAIAEELRTHYNDGQLKAELTGFIKLMGDVESYLIESQIQSFVLAFVVITTLMLILLRSVKLGLFSVIPNLLPILMGLGWMALLGIDLDPGTVMIGSIALGLVVDDTVHFLVRLRRHQADGQTLEEAIASTMLETGRPIIVTSVALAAGFSVMALGTFTPNVYFGLVSAVVMILALVAAVVLLPAALLELRPGSRQAAEAAEPISTSAAEAAVAAGPEGAEV